MLALVDGDVFKWRWAAAGEYDLFTLRDDETQEVFAIRGKKKVNAALKENSNLEVLDEEHVIDPLPNVLHSVKLSLENIQKVCGCNSPRIFLGGKDNFRMEINPDYKSSRAGRERPYHQEEVIKYLVDQWNAEFVDGIEADDAMAMYQTKDTVICSPDKDMLQVPGKHYNFVNDEKICVTPKDGDFNLYTQILTGDSTDDIQGLKGIGPVKATKLLQGAKSTKDLFEKALGAWKGDIDGMIKCARQVYLLRSPDDCYTHRKEVKEFLGAST